MPTTHYAFRPLLFDDQYATILAEGIFLLTRYEEPEAVHLYHMLGGFFAELRYNPPTNEVQRIYQRPDARRLPAVCGPAAAGVKRVL